MLMSCYILESGIIVLQAPKLRAQYTPGKGPTLAEILPGMNAAMTVRRDRMGRARHE